MKNKDITKPVMHKIIAFEKKRSGFLRTIYKIVIISLSGLILLGFLGLTLQLYERGTLDVIELFQEDIEIISEYWNEAFDVFLAELPQETILFIGFTIILIILIRIITRHQRKIIQNRIEQIKTYEKN